MPKPALLLLAACTTGGTIRVDSPLPPSDCSLTTHGGDDPSASLVPRFLGVEATLDPVLVRGTTPTLRFGLENVSPDDDMAYPQLELYVEDLVEGDLGTVWYGLFGGQLQEVRAAVAIPADYPGATVTWEASATRLNCEADCPEENLLTVTLCVSDLPP